MKWLIAEASAKKQKKKIAMKMCYDRALKLISGTSLISKHSITRDHADNINFLEKEFETIKTTTKNSNKNEQNTVLNDMNL